MSSHLIYIFQFVFEKIYKIKNERFCFGIDHFIFIYFIFNTKEIHIYLASIYLFSEEQRTPGRGEIVFEIDFYNGNCSNPSVQESIEQQFIDFINSEIEKGTFVGVDKNNYTIDKVESSCDSDGRRRKRSLSGMQNISVFEIHEMGKRSHIPLHKLNNLYTQQLLKIARRSQNTYHKLTKRSTYGDVQTVSVAMSYIWDSNSSSLETQLVENDKIVNDVWVILEAACDSGKLNFTGSAHTCDFQHPAYPTAICEPGEEIMYIGSVVYCRKSTFTITMQLIQLGYSSVPNLYITINLESSKFIFIECQWKSWLD